jgi:hypothetical protein
MNLLFGDWVEVCLADPQRALAPSGSSSQSRPLNGGGIMVANALLVAVAILLGYLFWLMGELKKGQ